METYDTLKAWGISKEDLVPKKVYEQQIRDLNEQPIFDMVVRRAYKFLVSLLDKEDKAELGLNENKEDDDRIISAAEANMVNRLRYQVMMLDKGHIDKDDFINAVEEIAFDKIKEQEK